MPSADRQRFYGGDVLRVERGSEVSEQSSFRVGLSNGIESLKLISIAIDFNLEQGYGELRATVKIKSRAALVGRALQGREEIFKSCSNRRSRKLFSLGRYILRGIHRNFLQSVIFSQTGLPNRQAIYYNWHGTRGYENFVRGNSF